MRVLIACECSGAVRRAFRAFGHDAWSCDREPAADGSPFHYQDDAIAALRVARWDLVIAHPPCTYLSNSGALRLYAGGKKANGPDALRWANMRTGAAFFRSFFTSYAGPLCVENPVMHGHALREIGEIPGILKQIVQPNQFGDDASKATVLWLRGLPRLMLDAKQFVPPRMVNGRPRWANQTDSGQNKLAPSPTRGAARAVTYQGIAKAMAEQWGNL